LTQALAAGVFERTDLAGLIDAREMEAEPEIPDLDAFVNYARGTAGRLARISGKLLGQDCDAAEALGAAYGISGILRAAPYLAAQGRSLLPADGTAACCGRDRRGGSWRRFCPRYLPSGTWANPTARGAWETGWR
jgi:phytoene synthase